MGDTTINVEDEGELFGRAPLEGAEETSMAIVPVDESSEVRVPKQAKAAKVAKVAKAAGTVKPTAKTALKRAAAKKLAMAAPVLVTETVRASEWIITHHYIIATIATTARHKGPSMSVSLPSAQLNFSTFCGVPSRCSSGKDTASPHAFG